MGRYSRRAGARADEAGFDRISVMDHVWQIGHLGPPENEMLEAYTTSKARIPYSTGEVLNHVAVSEDSGRPNSSARESALVVMLVIAVLLPFVRIGRHAAVGQDGQASDGRLCAGSYKVTPPGRSRAYSTTQQAISHRLPLAGQPVPGFIFGLGRSKDSRIASGLRRVRPTGWCRTHPHWPTGRPIALRSLVIPG